MKKKKIFRQQVHVIFRLNAQVGHNLFGINVLYQYNIYY